MKMVSIFEKVGHVSSYLRLVSYCEARTSIFAELKN